MLLIIKFMDVHHQKQNKIHILDLNYIKIVLIVYHFVVQVMIFKINNYNYEDIQIRHLIMLMEHGLKSDKNIGLIYQKMAGGQQLIHLVLILFHLLIQVKYSFFFYFGILICCIYYLILGHMMALLIYHGRNQQTHGLWQHKHKL